MAWSFKFNHPSDCLVMMASTSVAAAAPHVLMYPFSASGHITPLLHLAHRLVSSNALRLTLAVTPNLLPLLDPLRSSGSPFETLLLPPVVRPSLPGLHPLLRALSDLHRPFLLLWLRSHPSPPLAIISDYFLGWTNLLGLPRLVFSPSGAFSISLSLSLWRHLPHIASSVSFPAIPASPSYRPWELPHRYATYRGGDPDWDFFRDSMLQNSASWGAIFNSFADLERPYLDHVKTEMGHGRVWAVGPLLPPPPPPPQREGVLTWLDGQPDCSVVYVCFGSRVALDARLEGEVAGALEQSGVGFVWCAREFAAVDGGFEDRVAGRGLLIRGWAPQVAVLGHRAVATFLTHCGWNSVLEGLAAGVLMLAWPMDSDQFTNAKLLVDQLGVGVRVGEGAEHVPDSAALARVLIESVKGKGAERDRAKKLRDAAETAVKGGSSSKDLDDLVDKLCHLKNGKRGGNKNVAVLVGSLLVVCIGIGLAHLFR